MAEDVMLPTGEKKKYIKGDGHFVRNCIIEALWADVANKIKLLEVNLIKLFSNGLVTTIRLTADYSHDSLKTDYGIIKSTKRAHLR